MLLKYRKPLIVFYFLLAFLSVFGLFNLKFRFDFEQFFPEGDKDLEFYQNFIKDFESDNNFILVGLPRKEGVFDIEFLKKVQKTTNELKKVDLISKSQSLTNIRYPIKTPFGFTTKPMINVNDPKQYESNQKAILEDPRFAGSFINKEATALTIALKTSKDPDIKESKTLINSIEKIITKNGLKDFHILGRANFQFEMVRIQQKEFIFCTLFSLLLVIVLIKIFYYRWTIVLLTLITVFTSMLIFAGSMSLLSRELSLMSALYPVIILIASTSDIIHIITKYIDELKKDRLQADAIKITLNEIGLSTFITSATTAIGFSALLTSKLPPVRDFGLNSALGVMLAFIVTVPLILCLLSFYTKEQLSHTGKTHSIWANIGNKIYQQTKKYSKIVKGLSLFSLLFGIWGITKISTNYSIQKTIPLSEKVGQDFMFFEENFSGFRPLEFAVITKSGEVTNYEFAQEIDKLENKLSQTKNIGNVLSPNTLIKSYYRVINDNIRDSFKLPPNDSIYQSYMTQLGKLKNTENNILISKDNKKARISSRIGDIGADSIKIISDDIDDWIKNNINPEIAEIKQTGTGLILDKNSQYVKVNLLQGLLYSVLMISILLALILKNWKILFISLIPNILPLILVGGLLGWLGIDLEAGISIIFGIIFGIVVDDTIHFFGRFKIAMQSGNNKEDAIRITLEETGRAMIFTTIILFFAFLTMLFASQPLTKVVGLLLSVTFIAALLYDLYLLPLLLRWFYKP
jgi:predicted RND superfamily exporter protein